MNIDDVVTTRRSWHAAAELLLAGPAYADHADIRLTPTDGGLGIWRQPGPRLELGDLVAAGRRVPLMGTIGEVAAAAGVTPRDLDDVYSGGSGATVGDILVVVPQAAALLAGIFAEAGRALGGFAPDAEAVLWPEHFDIGISVDEVNYGISPGDDYEPRPYAYVGPWTVPASGGFWNAPFGAAVPVDELGGAFGIVGFFEHGRRLCAGGP